MVAVMLENRLELLAILAALSKLGTIGALINTTRRGKVLAHSLNLVEPGFQLVGGELLAAFDEIAEHLDRELPAYAAPLFIRRLGEVATTGTFKYQKSELPKSPTTPRAWTSPCWSACPPATASRCSRRRCTRPSWTSGCVSESWPGGTANPAQPRFAAPATVRRRRS